MIEPREAPVVEVVVIKLCGELFRSSLRPAVFEARSRDKRGAAGTLTSGFDRSLGKISTAPAARIAALESIREDGCHEGGIHLERPEVLNR